MKSIETQRARNGTVNLFASIIEPGALAQSEMISRGHVTDGPVAVMPDAHQGMGACVGTAIRTKGGIYPAAVGVDIGCGVIALKLDIKVNDSDLKFASTRNEILGGIRETVPAGVFTGFKKDGTTLWRQFYKEFGSPPKRVLDEIPKVAGRMASQFGTLGSGNHFVEVSHDEDNYAWILVHSGSRGPGNLIAQHFINIAKENCAQMSIDLEHADMAFLVDGTKDFSDYIEAMIWAQNYAFHQRVAMSTAVFGVVNAATGGQTIVLETINCHHNYSMPMKDNLWLSRKGAIDASPGIKGVIPGSMGAASFIVEGLGNPDSHNTSAHGAGRLHSRGSAKRNLSLEDFKRQMEVGGRTWQDRDAVALLDEAPEAYKPIEVVMEDSKTLVKPLHLLQAIINFKGV